MPLNEFFEHLTQEQPPPTMLSVIVRRQCLSMSMLPLILDDGIPILFKVIASPAGKITYPGLLM